MPAAVESHVRCGLGVATMFVMATVLQAPIQFEAAGREIPIRYSLDKRGFVSVAVYDQNGRMVRPLMYGQKQDGGHHQISWDGLDRYGQPQPPGEYEWRLLQTPGFTRRFLVNLGTNITWAPVDYWPGNHAGPTSVMVDKEGHVYVASISSEGPPALIKMSHDGKQLLFTTGTWGWDRRSKGIVDLARIGDVLYALCQDGTLEIRRAETGGRFHGHPKLRRFAEQRIPYFNLLDRGEGLKQVATQLYLAAGKDFLVVSYLDYDRVRLLWPRDDVVDKDISVNVSKPTAVAVANNGNIYVACSPHRIARIDSQTGKATTLVSDPDLLNPGRMTYEPVNGDLIVTNGDHLRRYHVETGKLVAVYGRADGRTYGVFNPLDFDTLRDVAADGQGGFFIVESYPRRVAHFRGREKHQLVRQWIGGMPWAWQAILDPQNPKTIYLSVDGKHLGRGEIYPSSKTWSLTHLYEKPDGFAWGANGYETRLCQNEGGMLMFPTLGSNGWQVRHMAGETFLVNLKRGVSVIRVDEEQNRVVPVARLGSLHPTNDRRNPPEWWINVLQRMGIDVNSAAGSATKNSQSFTAAGGYKHFAYSWSDTNRNGNIDLEEIRLASVGHRFTEHYCFVDEDWNAYWPAVRTSDAAFGVIPHEGTNDRLPVWNWDHERSAEAKISEREATLLGRPYLTSISVDLHGATYATVESVDHRGGDMPPLSWPNNASTASRIMKWDVNGNLMFSLGVHASIKDGAPGEHAGLRQILGDVRGHIVVRDACAPATVWTNDGLYAGSVHTASGPASRDVGLTRSQIGPDGQPTLPFFDDVQDGQVLETAGGNVLWAANETQNTVVHHVTGWDGWVRRSGKLNLRRTAPAARWQGTGLNAEIFDNQDLSGTPILRRTDPEIWFGPMWGDHRHIKPKTLFFADGQFPAGIESSHWSARWTGFVEPPVSEAFSFVVFTYGDGGPTYNPPGKKGSTGSRVRLWVNNKLTIDNWEHIKPDKVNGWYRTQNFASGPIPLTAGKRIPIKLEFSAAGDGQAHLHLYWESRNWELRHVPSELLYPDQAHASSPVAKHGTAN